MQSGDGDPNPKLHVLLTRGLVELSVTPLPVGVIPYVLGPPDLGSASPGEESESWGLTQGVAEVGGKLLSLSRQSRPATGNNYAKYEPDSSLRRR